MVTRDHEVTLGVKTAWWTYKLSPTHYFSKKNYSLFPIFFCANIYFYEKAKMKFFMLKLNKKWVLWFDRNLISSLFFIKILDLRNWIFSAREWQLLKNIRLWLLFSAFLVFNNEKKPKPDLRCIQDKHQAET